MSNTDRARTRQIATIQEGAAAGYYTLPNRLSVAIAAEETIRQHAADARRRQQTVIGADGVASRLSDAILDAARTGSPMPDIAAEVEAAESAERRAATEVAVWSAAAEAAEQALLYAVSGETVITQSLQPAHVALMTVLATLAPKLAPYDVSAPERMLQAPAEARKAFSDLIALADRYDAIRTARAAASRMDGGPRQDVPEDFSQFRDPSVLHGAHWAARAQFGLAPVGPTDRLSRLLWVGASKAGAWMPTHAEQDEAALADREQARTRTKLALRPVGVAVGRANAAARHRRPASVRCSAVIDSRSGNRRARQWPSLEAVASAGWESYRRRSRSPVEGSVGVTTSCSMTLPQPSAWHSPVRGHWRRYLRWVLEQRGDDASQRFPSPPETAQDGR